MATAPSPTTTEDRTLPDGAPTHLADAGDLLVAPLRALAFWAAVALPFVTLAVLLGPGVDAATLVGLLGANVAAVVGGHGYGR